MNKEMSTISTYRPDRLFHVVQRRLGLHSDGTLSQKLRLRKRLMEDMRQGRVPVTATVLLLISEASGISIDELRHIMGDRRAKLRLGCRTLATPAGASALCSRP